MSGTVKPGYVRPLDLKHGRVDLSHGSGGRAMAQLVEQLFLEAFDNEWLRQRNDQARFAVQDASLGICPERLHPWCPLPEGVLRIERCYRGEDCWLGAYNGASAHGGLDINHPAGTPLWAPVDIHDQYLFNSLAMGQYNNNRGSRGGSRAAAARPGWSSG